MQFTLSIGLDRLKDLPLDMRQEIQRALALPMQAVATSTMTVNQPVYVVPPAEQQPVPSQPQTAQPVVAYVEPVVTKQPIIQGNSRVFLPDRGHPTQQNAAIDVMTGQPQQIAAPQSAPTVPMVSNTPVNVSPVATTGPVAMNLQPQADLAAARQAAIRLYNDPSRGGNDTLNVCLQTAGLRGMAELNQTNAAALYGAILQRTGSV